MRELRGRRTRQGGNRWGNETASHAGSCPVRAPARASWRRSDCQPLCRRRATRRRGRSDGRGTRLRQRQGIARATTHRSRTLPQSPTSRKRSPRVRRPSLAARGSRSVVRRLTRTCSLTTLRTRARTSCRAQRFPNSQRTDEHPRCRGKSYPFVVPLRPIRQAGPLLSQGGTDQRRSSAHWR